MQTVGPSHSEAVFLYSIINRLLNSLSNIAFNYIMALIKTRPV